jgi:TRAP-type C4-dicarboxylate transport system permease small subunit
MKMLKLAAPDKTATLLSGLVGVALVVAVLINVVNVLGRYGFNHIFTGADDVEIYLMIFIAFSGGLIADIRQRHLRMDVLSRHFPPAPGYLVKGAEALLGIAVCGMMTWVSWNYTFKIFRIGSLSENAHIAMWIPHSVLAVSFTLMTLAGLARLFSRAQASGLSISGKPTAR